MKKLYAVVVVATFLLIALLAATKISDPDTMQYLAAGRYTLTHGLEDGCVFNYSSDQCQVVYSQWLFHVLTYLLYVVGGWNGLVLFQVLIATGIFGVVFVRQRRHGMHALVTVPIFLLAAMVARERFILRADLFALLPAVLLYWAFEKWFDDDGARRGRRLAGAMGAIQVVWANTHGSFPVAFLLLGAFLATSLAPSRRPTARRLLLPVAVVVAASFLNPYGFKAFAHPFQFMLQGATIAPQAEFASPFAPADLEHTTILAFELLLVVAVALLLVSFRAIRVRDLLVLAPLAYLAITSVRHVALFAVFCALLLPRYGEELRRRIAKRSPGTRATALPVAIVLLLAIAGIGTVAATDEIYRFDAISRRTGFGISDLVYPIGAAAFVEENDLQGNMFNDYSVGTYLNFRLFPARKTFIDGHTYTPGRLAFYRDVMAGQVPYQQVVETFRINYFLLNHKSSETRTLIASLARDQAWALVYFDEIAMVFLKWTPGNAAFIGRHRIDLATSSTRAPEEPSSIRNPEDFYLGHTDRGLVLFHIARDDAARAELEQAAQENPRSFVTQTALGVLLARGQQMQAAREAFERSIATRSGYAPAHLWLGVLEVRDKKTQEGIAELERALSINRKMVLAHFYLGVAYELQGDKSRALEHYRRELEVNPSYQPAQAAARRLG